MGRMGIETSHEQLGCKLYENLLKSFFHYNAEQNQFKVQYVKSLIEH